MITSTVANTRVQVHFSGARSRTTTLGFIKDEASNQGVFDTVDALLGLQDFTGVQTYSIRRIMDHLLTNEEELQSA